jgi:aryl-alcohol dehydrogenase-like predicted oxidoreductase
VSGGVIDESDLTDTIRKALELGINFFDPAQAYGFAAAEQLLGNALEPEIKNRRDEIVLATKVGLRMEGDQPLRDSSSDWLRQGVEDSLRFLGTDHIDLYQIH